MPQPDIEFAAAYLADKDVKTLHGVTDGTIYAQFRVRGVGQFGTILAARDDDRQIMNVDIDDDGFVYRAFVKGQWCEYRAHGDWNDGGWHDLVIRAFRGAVDIYVDGNMETHQPGQVFFGDLEGLSYVSIGEDTAGVRLCGEVRGGGLFLYPLGEGQIRKISDVPPTTDTALFDKGYEGSASYRIPSLVTTPSGVPPMRSISLSAAPWIADRRGCRCKPSSPFPVMGWMARASSTHASSVIVRQAV